MIQVIETKVKRGIGTEKDPVREVSQYWGIKGDFLTESDAENCFPCVEHDAKVVYESIT